MAPVTRRGTNTPPNNPNPNNMTPKTVQAMINQALMRNSTNRDGSHSSHGDNRRNVQTARPCFYADFMKCQTLNFKGNKGVVGLTRWIEKMESVFNISGCAIKNHVKFATCTLLVLKKKMTDKYCPQGEIKKLEIELWNLKVKGNDVLTYTECFQELTLICTKFVANETEKVDKYISGLPDNIYGNVKSARPKTLDETIELANDLMDQKLRTYAERQSDNKRKADDSSRNNHGHQQQPFKRQNVAKVYNMGSGEKKPYGGSLPKCTKCHFHHNGPCTQKCHKCNKVGHFARDCRSSGNTNVANTQKGNGANPKGNGCFECGAPGHFKRDCPKLKNKDGGNGSAQGWVYAVGNAEKKGNASRDPDSNVITANTPFIAIEMLDGTERRYQDAALYGEELGQCETYIAPSYTKKVFGNMRRLGKGFSRRETPLFPTMVVQHQEEISKGSEMPIDPQHTPTITQPSTSQPKKKQKPRKPKRKNTEVPQPSGSSKHVTDEAYQRERDKNFGEGLPLRL
ncbi:putative reverse transcriptase domain-containing protein [Tanacetum coccineum]